MARPVSGFLTDDGVFYEGKEEAEKHESIVALTGAYQQYVGHNGNFDRFSNVILNLMPEIRRYFNAVEGPEDRQQLRDEVDQATVERDTLQASRPDYTKAREHTSDDGLGGSFEGVLQQPAGGPLHVPDVGDRAWAEEVRKRL